MLNNESPSRINNIELMLLESEELGGYEERKNSDELLKTVSSSIKSGMKQQQMEYSP
jgi:hypothetical protein